MNKLVKVLLFFLIFPDWLTSYIDNRYRHDGIIRNDRACGLPIVKRVTRGNFCSGEQYVALTYCASATSASWCCHATRRYRNSRCFAICILWKGEFQRIRAAESRTFLSSLPARCGNLERYKRSIKSRQENYFHTVIRRKPDWKILKIALWIS